VNFKFTECTRIIIPPKHSAFSWYDLKWFKCMWTLVHRNARGVLYLLNTVHFNILLNTITVWRYLQLTLVSCVIHTSSTHSQLFAGSVSQSLDSSSKYKRVIGRLIVFALHSTYIWHSNVTIPTHIDVYDTTNRPLATRKRGFDYQHDIPDPEVSFCLEPRLSRPKDWNVLLQPPCSEMFYKFLNILPSFSDVKPDRFRCEPVTLPWIFPCRKLFGVKTTLSPGFALWYVNGQLFTRSSALELFICDVCIGQYVVERLLAHFTIDSCTHAKCAACGGIKCHVTFLFAPSRDTFTLFIIQVLQFTNTSNKVWPVSRYHHCW